MKKRSAFLLTLLLGLVLLLWQGRELQSTLQQALQLCGSVLIPALFPYLVLSRLFVSFADELPEWICRPLKRVFGLSKAGCSAVLIGAIGGYPSGASAVANLYQCGKINRTEAERLLAFACNCGPAFCCSVIGIGIYGSLGLGLCLYGIMLVSSFLCGLLTQRKQNVVPANDVQNINTQPFMTEFVSAVTKSAESMLHICGFVCLFSLLIGIERKFISNILYYAIMAGVTELSSGVFPIATVNIPWTVKFSLIAFVTAFGGACVVMQTGALLQPAHLSIKPYLRGKLLQGLLAGILAVPASMLFQGARKVALFPTKIVPISPWPWFFLSILLTLLIFLKIPTGKNGAHPL